MRTFDIDGKPRPFLFGLSAATPILEIFYEEGAGEKALVLGITKKAAHVAYLAFLAGARAEKQEIDFTEDDVSVWLDLNYDIFEAISVEIGEFMERIGQKKSNGLAQSSSEASTVLKNSKPKKQRAG